MVETLLKSLLITGGIILFCGILVLVGFTANDILKLLRIESSNTRFIISVIAMIFTLIALMITSNDVNFEIINGVNFALLETNNFSHNQIVETVSKIKGEKESTIVLLLNQNLEKADVCVGVSNNLLNKYRAGDLVKKVCLVLNGSGGGRNDIAFGGIKTLENKKQAIEELKNNL